MVGFESLTQKLETTQCLLAPTKQLQNESKTGRTHCTITVIEKEKERNWSNSLGQK